MYILVIYNKTLFWGENKSKKLKKILKNYNRKTEFGEKNYYYLQFTTYTT